MLFMKRKFFVSLENRNNIFPHFEIDSSLSIVFQTIYSIISILLHFEVLLVLDYNILDL